MIHSEGFLSLVDDAKRRVQEITIDALRQLQEEGKAFELIDVREDHEWEKGRLPGARHLGKGILERDIESKVPDRDACVVLYCAGGFRSALAADALQKMGYTSVYSLAGGFKAWRDRDLPLAGH